MKYFSEKVTIIVLAISSVCNIILSGMLLSGCGYNKQILDLDYKYNVAIIEGVGEIEVKSWNDYENSDMVQVTDKDGNVYLTHSSNIILMYKK